MTVVAKEASREQLACPEQTRIGSLGHANVDEIITAVSGLAMMSRNSRKWRGARLRAVRSVLAALEEYPGDSWQERWMATGADQGWRWLDELAPRGPRAARAKRTELTCAVSLLMLARVVLPAYTYFPHFRSRVLFQWTREQHQPDVFAQMERAAADIGMPPAPVRDALNAVTRAVLHTGRDPGQITAEDLRNQTVVLRREKMAKRTGVNGGWDLLAHIGIVPDRLNPSGGHDRIGQLSVEAMVDRYKIQGRAVRGVLIRYLAERAPALDYTSLRSLAAALAGRFWADIERHHPGLDTLRLPPGATQEWKQRQRTYTTRDGSARPRKDYFQVLGLVRAFYLDIQEWAHEDPSWAEWATPSPIRRTDLTGMGKERRKTVAEMHQRVRERLPHLLQLADSAASHRATQARLLAAAFAAEAGQEFSVDGVAYCRVVQKSHQHSPALATGRVLAENTVTGEVVDVTKSEDDAFWSWAVVETLRHTGCRMEELLELTHLAIISYRLPKTGEAIPLLQVVPSKSSEERLLLVSPEFASVLTAIVKRLRDEHDGTIRLVARYDPNEKVTGPPLPHLFQRRAAWRPSVIGPNQATRLINDAIARAGITDTAGQPLRYTAHDFRRMFATEAVTGGLPVHIAARILGHRTIATTEIYLAVFQDDLISAYQTFLGKRRAQRPEAEYREPTEQEWREFEEHFEKRRLEIGTCGRPYGTPCNHEHACIRCPMLRPDPAARERLADIIKNLTDRISEARLNGWLGEVEGLQISLNAARGKLTTLDRTARNSAPGTTDLGIPSRRTPTQETSASSRKPS